MLAALSFDIAPQLLYKSTCYVRWDSWDGPLYEISKVQFQGSGYVPVGAFYNIDGLD